tara:strand:- start:202 stop:513 length:312 start_codon:yes stop_codon:yes gene_type:complete
LIKFGPLKAQGIIKKIYKIQAKNKADLVKSNFNKSKKGKYKKRQNKYPICFGCLTSVIIRRNEKKAITINAKGILFKVDKPSKKNRTQLKKAKQTTRDKIKVL